MNERQILSSLCLAATVWLGGLDTSQAAAFGPAAGVNYDLPNFANSPLPTVNPNGTVSGGLRKFVDGLPGLGSEAANNLGQFIPQAAPDTTSYPGSDYYEIALVEYREQMHSDLGGGTRLRGYVQIYPPGTTGSGAVQLNYPNGSPITVGGQPVYAHAQPHYLGPLIIAQKDRPTRIKFYNLLPTGAAGRLFIPVDTTIMGAGEGGWALDENGNQVFTPGGMFTENRATLHLHGGNTPWISDGTPHQWTVPAGEATPYKKGVASVDVPDMSSGEGSMTFYYPNQQSGRLMFYHDHSYGITRLNVYAGEAAGYLLVDPAERDLTNGNTPGIPAMPDIPLVIEDKTFVWGNAGAGTGTYEVDPTWAQVVPDSQPGDLWFPHVYMANQDPTAFDGFNPVGRWDYGAWFWPVFPSLVPPAITSTVPESFMDTMTVNGTAYPTVTVNPQAYRFRILDASNDRFVNLSLWVADPLSVAVVNGGNNYSPSPTVTINDPTGTGATASAYVYGGVIQEIMISGTPVNYSHPVITINDTSGTGAKVVASANTELKMVYLNRSQNRITPFPTHWYDAVLDDRDGGVPHPATRGPAMIQIGTEGGLLPAPAVVLNQPVNFDYDRRSVTVLNVLQHALFLGPAERADVIIDFTPFAGKTLILYNDSPAPVPAADPRVDYYTGNPDQVASGGAPTTLPGYGPNTRTIMQIKVGGSGGAAPVDSINSTILSTLQAALPAAFAATQEKPIIPEPTYPIASGGNSLVATYSRIANNNLSFTPVSELKVGGNVIPAGTPTTVPLIPKAIQELFDPYGRMNSILGTELPFTTALNQTTIPLAYIDPTTETIPDGETQFWKITHNGVDTHAIHFHLVNVQIINRIGWDNAVKPPEENELGWKDTVRMNPLEDIVVAATAKTQRIPWVLPNSVRPLDVTQPLGSSLGFTQVNPLTGGNPTPNPIVNRIEDFAWEYVWHCHILGHEEDDMMRPLVMPVTGTDYVMDQVAPTVTITLAPPANPSGWNNTDVAVSINAVDGPLTPVGTASGLSSISYGATGANSVANTTTPVLTSGINPASVNVAALTLEGDTTVSASAKDHALNTGSALPVVVKIDKTAPSTTATLAGTTGQNGYYTSDVTVTLAATDAASGVASTSYSVDGGGSTGYSATFVVTGDGIHTVTLSSTDVAGNIETGNSITIKIDAGAPTISVVATPAANGNGWNNSNVDLAFSASDAGSGVASITYNDGSAPTTVNAATANLTLSAEGTTSVAFFATDTAGSSSASQSIAVKIDKTAPSTAASLAGTAGSNGYYTTDVSVTLNATDAGSGVASSSYSVDGGASTTYAGAFVVSGDGEHTVTFSSVDQADNTEASQSVTIKIDGTAPTLSVVASPAANGNGWNNLNVDLAFSASDAGSGVASITYNDGSAPTTVNAATANLTLSTEGTTSVAFFATDTAGSSSASQSITVKIDKTAPSTAASLAGTAGSNGYYTTDVSVTLNATDAGSGVASTSFSVDGGASTAYAGAFMVSGDGEHTVTFSSIDQADNTEASQSVTIKIDGTAPTLSVVASPAANGNGWNNSNVDLAFSASDAGSGVASITYNDGSAPTTVNAATANLTLSTEGTTSVAFFATDTAGSSSASQSIALKIDKTAPSTAASLAGTAGSNGYYTTDVSVTLNATDAVSGVASTSFSVDGGASTAYAGAFMVSGDGEHTVTFSSIDQADNAEAGQSVTIKIDTQLPVASATLSPTPTVSGYNTNTVTVGISGTDGGSGIASITYSATGAQTVASTTVNGTSANLDLSNDGTTTVTYYVTDAAGNSSASQDQTVKIDSTAPTTTSSLAGTAGSNGYYTADVTVTLTADDGTGAGVASTKYKLDGGAEQTYAAPFIVTGDGNHTVEFWSTDVLDLVETAQSVTIKIDSTAPTASAVKSPSANGAGWNIANVTVNLGGIDNGSGIASITYSASGSQNVASTSVPGDTASLVISVEGTTVVSYSVTDNAGNSTSGTATVKLDKTQPSISNTVTPAPNGAGWWKAVPVTVNFTATDALSGLATLSPVTFDFTAQGANQSTTANAFDVAGNTASSTVSGINIDLTAPTLTFGAITPAPNAAGWNKTPVTITYNASDALSGVANSIPTSPLSFGSNGAGQTQSVTVTDVAGNSAVFTSPTVKIDMVAPTAVIDPAPNIAGWLNTSTLVPVSVIVSDPALGGSGLVSASYRTTTTGAFTPLTIIAGQAVIPVSNAAGTRTVYVNATDAAGNSISALPVTIKIDRTAPTVSSATSSAATSQGWYRTNFNVTITGSDGTGSGVATLTYTDSVNGGAVTPVTINGGSTTLPVTVEGIHVFTYFAVDNAGNISSTGTRTVRLDKTAPIFTSLTATPNDVLRTTTGSQSVTIAGAVNEFGTATAGPASNVASGTYTVTDSDGATFTGGTFTVSATTGAFSFARSLPRQVISEPDRIYTFTLSISDRAFNGPVTQTVTLRIH